MGSGQWRHEVPCKHWLREHLSGPIITAGEWNVLWKQLRSNPDCHRYERIHKWLNSAIILYHIFCNRQALNSHFNWIIWYYRNNLVIIYLNWYTFTNHLTYFYWNWNMEYQQVNSSAQDWCIAIVNSLGPSDAIWQQRSGSTLAQVITWTNVDSSSVRSSDIHLRAFSQELPQPSITEDCLKINYLKIHSNLRGANELMHWIYHSPALSTVKCCYNEVHYCKIMH